MSGRLLRRNRMIDLFFLLCCLGWFWSHAQDHVHVTAGPAWTVSLDWPRWSPRSAHLTLTYKGGP